MEPSILTSTKKVVGIAEAYTAFDLDIITHINGAFSTLHQLGIGPDNGFMIEDAVAEWDDFTTQSADLNTVRMYVFLRVRIAFDPPGTSFLMESLDKQIKELEWRLDLSREVELGGQIPSGTTDNIIDGGSPGGWD